MYSVKAGGRSNGTVVACTPSGSPDIQALRRKTDSPPKGPNVVGRGKHNTISAQSYSHHV